MRVTLLFLLLLAFAGKEMAQDLSHFEVASVRPAAPFPGAPSGGVPVFPIKGGIGTSDPGQITYRGVWLPTLINTAYSLRNFQLSGPTWLREERYDIVAKIPAGATPEQFNLMLQNLLRERFNLSFHRESRTFPVYALTLGKNGAKLKESSKAAEPPPPAGTVIGGADDKGFPSLPPGYSGVVARPANGRLYMTGQRVSLAKLTPSLENRMGGVDRPIVDETGLTGEYDFKLEFEWRRPGAVDTASDPAPSVFSALEKELGLKLEEKRLPFDVLVIDRLDKVPTEN